MADLRILFSASVTFMVLVSSNSSETYAPCNSTRSCGCDVQFLNNTGLTHVYQCLDGYALTGYVIKQCNNSRCTYGCFNLTNANAPAEDIGLDFLVNENNVSLRCSIENEIRYGMSYTYCDGNTNGPGIMPECTLDVNQQLQDGKTGSSMPIKLILIITTTAAVSICICTTLVVLCIYRQRSQNIPWTRQHNDKSSNEMKVTFHVSVITNDQESLAMTNADKTEANDHGLLDKQAHINVVLEKNKKFNECVNGEITQDNVHESILDECDTQLTTENSSKVVAETVDDCNNTYDTIVTGKTIKNGISPIGNLNGQDTVYDHLHARAEVAATNNIYSHFTEVHEVIIHNAEYAHAVNRGTEPNIAAHDVEQIKDTTYNSTATLSESRNRNHDAEESGNEVESKDVADADEEDAYSQILF